MKNDEKERLHTRFFRKLEFFRDFATFMNGLFAMILVAGYFDTQSLTAKIEFYNLFPLLLLNFLLGWSKEWFENPKTKL